MWDTPDQLYRSAYDTGLKAAECRHFAAMARHKAEVIEATVVLRLIEEGCSVAKAEKMATVDQGVMAAHILAINGRFSAEKAGAAERALYAAARLETGQRSRAVDRDEELAPAG